MRDDVLKAVARLDAASIEMQSAIDAINNLRQPLTAIEIEACRAAVRRARLARGER